MLVNPKYSENKLSICILIPGFIKSYSHLSYLEKLFKSISADKIYVFGHIFNYIIPPNVNKEKIVYDDNINDNKIDSHKLTIFNTFSYVSDNYTKYDKEGYDNRTYSQWLNIRKSFDLYLDFSKKNNIKCDMFIRMRSDLHISDITVLNKIITQSYIDNKIIFFNTCHVVNDQLFIGPYTLFKKIMLLSDNIYDYYLLDDIKKRIVKHKNNHRKPDFNKEIRFGGESEILLRKHINICLNKIDYILINHNKLFHIKRK